MAYAPKRPCPHPGCRALVDKGYCEQHKREQHRAYHASSKTHQENNQFYASARWRKVRQLHLDAEPLCRHCKQAGRLTAATHVDHITPRSAGGADFEDSNLQSLCKPCHEAKSRRESAGGGGAKIFGIA